MQSMMLLSFGVLSRWTMEVRVRREAALMSWGGGRRGQGGVEGSGGLRAQFWGGIWGVWGCLWGLRARIWGSRPRFGVRFGAQCWGSGPILGFGALFGGSGIGFGAQDPFWGQICGVRGLIWGGLGPYLGVQEPILGFGALFGGLRPYLALRAQF